MATLPHRVHYTFEEYLRLEEYSNVKHEYFDGQIYAMAGGTAKHSELAAAVTILIGSQVRGRCATFNSDLRVQTASGLTTYPDFTVVCKPIGDDIVTNPTLLVEVLSPSTEAYDRGEKFEHYKTITALQQYVLVSQDDRVVEVWTRGENWTSATYRDGETAPLPSIAAQLDIRELYDIAMVR